MNRFSKWSLMALLAGALVSNGAFAQDKKIARTWKAKCAACHGPDGKGQTEKGKKMKIADYTSPEWQKSVKDDELKKAILEGLKKEKDGVKQEMESFKDELSAEEVDGLVQFIRTLK